MSKSEFQVGIDVGKDELFVAVSGRKPRKFEHTRKGVRSLASWVSELSSGLEVRFCMESTGVYSLSLAHCLNELDSGSISVINPAQISAYARAQLRRCKTDRVDAEVILSFASCQPLSDWRPESLAQRHLCQLVTQADALQENLRQWRNRRHAQSYHPQLNSDVKKSQRAIERSLETQLRRLQTAIKQLCESEKELGKQVELLCSVPGIAELSAVRLLAYGKSALTEHNRKELTAHAGLAPRHYQSGTSVRGKSRIAKQGDRKLRTTLFMPAMVGIRHNPVLERLHKRLIDNGKPKMVAIVACMRKLLLIIQAMLKNQQHFNPERA